MGAGARALQTRSGSGFEKQPYAFQILWRVNSRSRILVADVHRYSVAVPHGAKLFQCFGNFQRRAREPGV